MDTRRRNLEREIARNPGDPVLRERLDHEISRSEFPDFRTLLPAPTVHVATWGHQYQEPRPPLLIGPYALSIQASEYNYSQPRLNGLSVMDYESWEVAIWETANRDRPWLMLNLPGHERAWTCDSVAGYVPTANVQAIYNALRNGAVPEPCERWGLDTDEPSPTE